MIEAEIAELWYILYPVVFIYGIVIGSFLNVCICRIPKHENIVRVNSHCMACGHRLKWYDLFPLFSWIFLRGKCRYCGEKISVQYPVIEALNGILYIVVFYINGWSLESVLWCIVTSCLIVLSVIDFRTMLIPVGTYIIILFVGVIHLIIDLDNWSDYVFGAVAAGAFLLIIAFAFRFITGKSGLGLGDIELMACAGMCLGLSRVFFAIIIGCVAGAVIEGIKIAITKKRGRFAFGPYLAAAIYICLLWGADMYEWYMGLAGL
ncbi:MAG: prepilin peptidase [Eubacterium sp.]|nr:prepilin peptidase [Eubacterium sp.]